ncbi:MAG: phage tail assembly chaperone [Candidatus Pseudomonas phytovorans]|uniref:Phage tail assembly chaperone n=1 Tax=Candidatus Pseudomonas phytovorans TaxID=3121377 RepID=A0AAJ5WKV1_9PSED|nr:phage tail assembly chaperone [Pseudomonas sp.]WEK32934.1 MAG: phage tail assembly chaperone [Pseudomonas sp.]
MLTVLDARDPQWNDAGHTSLNLWVTFAETADTLGEMPFTASPVDCESYGRELFERAVALDFGDVLEPSDAVMARAAALMLTRLTGEATSTISALQPVLATLQDAERLGMANDAEEAALPLKQAEYDAWCAYRVLLSRVPEQAGYPASINWPALPDTEDETETAPSPE